MLQQDADESRRLTTLAGGYVITSATITIEVDDVRRTVNLIVKGDDGRATDFAKVILEKLAAEGEPENYLGAEDRQVQ